MCIDYSRLSNFQLLELLKDLDSSDEDIGFSKWELDFIDNMIGIFNDISESNGDNAILSDKQRKCVINILEKY